MIKAESAVNARDADGMTPLMRCAHAALAAVLLDHGADINACSSGGITRRMHAVLNHDVPMMKLLLSRSASTEARDASGQTALYKACATCAPVTAHILLDAGVCATDQLLLHAVVNGKHTADTQLQHLNMLLLFAPALVNEADADGASPLMECIGLAAGCRLASALLRAGADVHAAKTSGCYHSGMTALHYAAFVGSPDALDMLNLLLAAGASADVQCSTGCLPLYNALRDSSCSKPKRGADVSARCSSGQTPLFYSREAAVTRLLVESGADVNARDYLGSTVLHDAAVHSSSAALLCSLLNAGAAAAAVNAYASAAADVAEADQRFEAAALLRQAESNQSVNFKLQQRAPMLPMHLLLHSRMPGWRRSSADMTDRSAVFGCLSGMALFDTELDKTELLQRVEFELYSTATDRAVYGDLDTVQQRAEPVCRAVSTQMRQRAAAAAVVESKGEAV
eukprot:2105-Heterococcus_DN1.PRE.3